MMIFISKKTRKGSKFICFPKFDGRPFTELDRRSNRSFTDSFFSSEFHEQRYLELYSPVSYQSSIYGFLEFHERTNHPYVDGIFSE